MLRIIWRFRAKSARVNEFLRNYGGDGAWVKLFERSEGYRGSVLLQDTSDPLVFVVIDGWARSDSFQLFRQQFGPDYEQLDRQCLELTEEEALIGHFRDKPV